MKASVVRMVVLMAFANVARAEGLFVIHDSGATIPTVPYFVNMQASVDDAKQRNEQPVKMPKSIVDGILPIRTPEMSPGTVEARAVNLPMIPAPFFIIGSDQRSKQWLVRYREKLVQLGAVGMLVQAETEQDLKDIADIALDLRVAPVNGAGVAKNLGLKHYPVLVSWQVIEQ